MDDYYAVSGGKVMLPCNISVSSKRAISMILWYKGEAEVPIYTLDARRSPLPKARHFPSVELGARVYFDVSPKTPHLKIDHVTEDDEGEYRCRIDFRRSRTVTHSVRLIVIVPPKAVIIKDDNNQILSETIGPLDEGSYLTIVCEADGGNPPPVISWWRGNVLLDDSYSSMPQGVVRNELLLPSLQRSDLLAVFLCQASNTNLTAPKSATVVLDLNLKPLDVHLITSLSHVSAGKKAKLTCESTGSRPPATITWWKDGKKLRNAVESITEGGNVTTSLLTIIPSADDNGKVLTCRSDHPSLVHDDLQDSWVMNVFYVPNITLDFGANIQHTAIKEGSDVYFECNIKANPWVTDVGWNFQGKPLYSNTSAGIIVSNQSLVLQKVKRDHRGFYQCTATNVEGEGASNKIPLEVQYAPICKNPLKSVYGVARDEATEVTCDVEASPENVKFRWSLNNSVDNIEITTHISNGTSSTVTYTPWSVSGYGALLCWGQNIIGYQKEPCVIRLIPAGPPDSVKGCLVTNLTTNSLTVECEAGYDGGMQQQFHLEVYNSAIEHLQVNLTSQDLPVFNVQNLPEGTSYVLVLYASNNKGRSNSVALMANTLPPAERRTANEEEAAVSPILGVLIGVIGALVLVAIIVTLVMKLQSDRSDKGALPQESINKCDTPLKKDTDDLPESTEKGPDIIPPNTDILLGYIGADMSERLHRTSEVMYPSVMSMTDPLHSITGNQAMKYRQYSVDPAYVELPRPPTVRRPMPDPDYPEIRRPTRMMLHQEQSQELDRYRQTPEWPITNDIQMRGMPSGISPVHSTVTTTL
ncbi:LOW QUALITY PROTEIN: nephrin-like [Centruroides vittatus]|uniref:LOW QUALITY PROTEIN: nephrin-like n=1 Tax=Centruroides vittatus TaxID=120091 RepID=UPI00350FA383